MRFGLNDPSVQRAYLSQFDAQLQSVVVARQADGLKANITASDFFRSLPPVGRLGTSPLSGFITGANYRVDGGMVRGLN